MLTKQLLILTLMATIIPALKLVMVMTFCAIDPLSFPFQVLPIADAPRFLSRLDFGMLEGFSLRTFHRKACQDNFSDTKADGRRVADQAFVQGHFCQGPRSCVLQAAVSASFCPFPERGF